MAKRNAGFGGREARGNAMSRSTVQRPASTRGPGFGAPGATVRTSTGACMQRILIAATLILALACVGADLPDDRGVRGADWTTSIDTLGDTIVARTTGGSDAATAQALTPEISIGVEDGADEYTFGQISEV